MRSRASSARETQRGSHSVGAAYTHVRRVCLYRRLMCVSDDRCEALVVGYPSCLSHATDKGLKNEHYRCDPVARSPGLGQGWASDAPTYTHCAPGARWDNRSTSSGFESRHGMSMARHEKTLKKNFTTVDLRLHAGTEAGGVSVSVLERTRSGLVMRNRRRSESSGIGRDA